MFSTDSDRMSSWNKRWPTSQDTKEGLYRSPKLNMQFHPGGDCYKPSIPIQSGTLPETNIAHENPIFPGKYHQNGGFSMAMLVYRRVYLYVESESTRHQLWYPTKFQQFVRFCAAPRWWFPAIMNLCQCHQLSHQGNLLTRTWEENKIQFEKKNVSLVVHVYTCIFMQNTHADQYLFRFFRPLPLQTHLKAETSSINLIQTKHRKKNAPKLIFPKINDHTFDTFPVRSSVGAVGEHGSPWSCWRKGSVVLPTETSIIALPKASSKLTDCTWGHGFWTCKQH